MPDIGSVIPAHVIMEVVGEYSCDITDDGTVHTYKFGAYVVKISENEHNDRVSWMIEGPSVHVHEGGAPNIMAGIRVALQVLGLHSGASFRVLDRWSSQQAWEDNEDEPYLGIDANGEECGTIIQVAPKATAHLHKTYALLPICIRCDKRIGREVVRYATARKCAVQHNRTTHKIYEL